MRVTEDDLLPIEFDLGEKKCITRGGCSLVGDIRGDENIALHAKHTLWIREHNRIATELKSMNPTWDDEKLFQTSRRIVGALWQHIAYTEYIPVLTSIPKYTGYKPSVDPSIINVFASAAFRYGHSLVPNFFAQLDNNFDKQFEPILLQDAFFNRQTINTRGIEPTMRGLIGNMSNEVDNQFAFSIARKLFLELGSEDTLDLTALNIQRARDHGLPGYNEFRKFCGLPVIKTFDDLKAVMLPDAAKRFPLIYKHPDDIDIFAGGISENHTIFEVGPTFGCLLAKQFTAVRDGDRFYYENPGVFTSNQLKAIRKVKLSTILCNNLRGLVSVQVNAFRTPSNKNFRRGCFTSIPQLDLTPWKEQNGRFSDQEEHLNEVQDIPTKEDIATSDESTAAGYKVSNDGPSESTSEKNIESSSSMLSDDGQLERKHTTTTNVTNEEATSEGYHVVSDTDHMENTNENNDDNKDNSQDKMERVQGSEKHQKKLNHNTIDEHMLKRLVSFLESKQAGLWNDDDVNIGKQTNNKQDEEKDLEKLTRDGLSK